jgi:uncharacterized DUF497 family protein
MNFDWDDGNRAKAQKHGVTLAEIEDAMLTGPRGARSGALADRAAVHRHRAYSRGRHVFIAFCRRAGRVRPISARYMHAREIAHHEAAQSSGDDDG